MLIVAPTIVEVTGPVVFLAGPIQGAPNWQKEAYRYLNSYMPGIHVATPRRDIERPKEFSVEMYNEQVDWETRYLRRASRCGTVLFWLAKEERHNCHRAYAQTSRFELGEWMERSIWSGCNLVVGIDRGFTNHRYIRRRLAQAAAERKKPIYICECLSNTCWTAMSLLYQ